MIRIPDRVWDERVTLVEGGPASAGDWQGGVGSLRRWLVAAGNQAAYAYIKRGRIPAYAMFTGSLEHDWVWREAIKVNQLVEIALEPRYAPDAFGIQLLGPGYAHRIPTAADWKVTPLDGGSVLLEHTDPAVWYADMFQTVAINVPVDKQIVPPTPAVVAQARRDLTGIILTEKIVYPTGRPNPPGH